MLSARVLLAVAVFLVTVAVVVSLPDLGEFFSNLGEKVFGKPNADDVTDSSHSRQRRQSPEIGDESTLHYEIRTSSVPLFSNGSINHRYMPTFANGHIGGSIFDDGIYLNGLYEGSGSDSHRARIPNLIMSRVRLDDPDVEGRASRKFINHAHDGIFMETIDCDFAYVEHKLYAHQKYQRIFVSDIFARRKEGNIGGGILKLEYNWLDDTGDLEFEQPRRYLNAFWQVVGRTKVGEDGRTQTIHMFWTDRLEQISLLFGNLVRNETMILSVDRHESSARSEFDKVVQILSNPASGHHDLFSEQQDTWDRVWERGRIEVEGEQQLAKITTFAQYYLLSSLPAPFPDQGLQHSEIIFGMSRASLARGGHGRDYHGHIMYDNEMHIMPAMILFHPESVKKVLRYRSSTQSRAHENAERFGGDGYHYSFRSARSGIDVSPETDTCPRCSWRRFHTSGAVSWLIRQYYSATRDQDYKLNPDYEGCDITREIAKFYADRAVYNPAHGRYDINNSTGLDEFHPDVSNNAYTLVLASLAIHWGRYFACLCQRNEREEVPDEWIQKALYMNLPFDNVKRQHYQHQGYNPDVEEDVSQADTIMLGYPLNWNMSLDIQRNDLELYELLTDQRAPALTWSFFAVGFKWVGLHTKAISYFTQSYQNYLIQPFKLWTEFNERNIEDQERGTVNFLPGMGGFLQSLVYGFAGIRIRPEMLEFHRPEPPPGATRIRLLGLQYIGSRMDVIIERDYRVTINVHSVGPYPLILRLNDTAMVEEDLNAGTTRNIDNAEQGFYIYSSDPEPCEHPRDYVYMPWGYSHWVDSAQSIIPSVFLLALLTSTSLLNLYFPVT